MDLKYVKSIPILLKDHPDFNEKWLQDRIAEDPSVLGLGDLELKDVERLQPKAGRLDLLLRDSETGKHFEVELMLGDVDASHIIRTLEYWDIERKRYPQYDHCAVIVAENVTSRFLNVIGLFNSAVPIIAIQLNALQVEDRITLAFCKVLDEIVLGEDDDEDPIDQPADRAYWEDKGDRETVKLADECLKILREIKSSFDLKYNKAYIGISENGRANNFVLFQPKKAFLRIAAKVADRGPWRERFGNTGFVVLEGISARRRFIFNATCDSLTKNRDLVKELFLASYKEQAD